jgi:hypothetical protein
MNALERRVASASGTCLSIEDVLVSRRNCSTAFDTNLDGFDSILGSPPLLPYAPRHYHQCRLDQVMDSLSNQTSPQQHKIVSA